jgi:hypothetical protein
VQQEGGSPLRANLALSADFVHDTQEPAALAKRIEALDAYRRYARA